jgi:DNA-binding CsgD family transcriptional regulator
MGLLGRLPELAACRETLSGDRDNAVAAVIAGPAGIGKTSLWRAVADCQSSSAVVLRTTGILGAGAGLANIADLLDPVLDAVLPVMPAPLAGALRAALGQVSPQAPVTDMLLERAIVGVLRGLAADGVVIAIDDEQWLDDDSRRLLETAVVRLASVPVRWLVSVRAEHALAGVPRMLCHELGAGAARVDVGGLDDGVLSELVMARFPGRWSPGVLRQVITLAAGNPYAAVELARETVACGEQAGTTARVPASLAVAVRVRLGRLGQPALATVQAAALAGAPTRELLRAVMPGPVEEHVNEALEAGILQASAPDPVLRFSHPLLREAAGDMLTGPRRRELHRIIGTAIGDPHEGAWHLARGADEPDEELAKRLDVAAEEAAACGAPAQAAMLARAAVELTPDQDSPQAWQRRLMWLTGLTVVGEFDQARRNGRQWAACVPASLRGQLSLWRAHVATDAEEQYELLVTALEELAGRDPYGAALAYAEASVALGMFLGRLEQARPLAAAAVPHARAAGRPPLLRGVLAAGGLLAALAGDPGAGDQLREAVRLPGFADSPLPYRSPEAVLALRHQWRGECCQARDLLAAVLSVAERVGSSDCAGSAKVALTLVEWQSGNWDAAAAYAQAAVRWSRETGHGRTGPVAVMSLVHAGYGEAAKARVLAASGLGEAEAQRDWAFAALCRWVLGQVELSVDDPEAALRWLDPVSDMLQASGIGEPGCYPFTPDLIEAWARTGHLAAAAGRLAWLQGAARRLDHPWARIVSGRAEAVLCLAERNPDRAVAAVASVVSEARDRQLPFELGRCLLVLGTAQRKARQRREAAACLDEAAATFERLGAARWRELAQAQRERLASGPDDALTPSERRVAELVAAGHTNAEIAAALFISVKTVEANLTRIYRKLGLRSRVDLARHSLWVARPRAEGIPDARDGAASATSQPSYSWLRWPTPTVPGVTSLPAAAAGQPTMRRDQADSAGSPSAAIIVIAS